MKDALQRLKDVREEFAQVEGWARLSDTHFAHHSNGSKMLDSLIADVEAVQPTQPTA